MQPLFSLPHTQEQALLDFFHLVRAAERLELLLPALVRERVGDPFHELCSRLNEALMRYRDPCTLDEVRRYEPCLRGHGLIYLLERATREGGQFAIAPAWKRDRWREWLYDFEEEGRADELLSDTQVHTVEDLAMWMLAHERQLFPDISEEDNGENG